MCQRYDIAFVIISLVMLFVFLLGDLLTKEHNPNLEIISFKVLNFDLSSRPNQISADWNVQMNLKNRDSHRYLKFSDIKVSINYNDKMIGVTNIMSFNASSKDPPRQFGEEFSGSSGYIDNSVISSLGQAIRAGNVKFDIRFEASVEITYHNTLYKIIKSEISTVSYIGNCNNVESFFGASDVSKAQMLNGPRKCKLEQVSTASPSYCPYSGYGYGPYGPYSGYGYGAYGYGYPGCV